MLRGIRKASSNWLGKAVMATVMGLLVVSFGIWGIGDIFRGFGRSTFAKIGHTEISIEQFRQIYNERVQQLGRQLNRSITLDQARAAGFDRQVLGQLVTETVLDERARSLGLSLSEADIVKRITSDPNFQTPAGQFDRVRFEQTIRQAGYTEPRFVNEQRRQLLRRQLAGTVISGPNAPKAVMEAMNRHQNEQRSIEYVLLNRAQAGEIPAPTLEVLTNYFEERKILFRAPEYRKVVIVALIPGQQANWTEVSDADLKRAYEERRARYVTPERRQIQQMSFPSADEAKAASDRIAKGATFDAIAKERGLSDKDIDLGLIARSALIDRAVADAAFALKTGEVSAPVQGRFGMSLIRVTAIEPEKVRTFEEVAGDLKREIATERARSEMLSVYDKIEDERSLGKTLAETAEKLKLSSRTIEVDRSGRDTSGNPVRDLPDVQRLLASAFSTDIGVENDPLQVEGGYVWYEVAGIAPAHDRALAEIKDKVETRWRDDEIAKRLKAKATEIMDKLKAGTAFAEVARASHLKLESKTDLKRDGVAPPLSVQAVDAIFRTAKGGTGSAEAAQPVEQIVFRVADVVMPTLDLASADAKQLRDALERAISDDIFAEYVAQLQREIGVTINQAALLQVITGRVSTDQDQ